MYKSNEELQLLANAGNKDAQYYLGLHYCMLNNAEKAFYWLKKAAFQCHEKAKEIILEILERELI